MTTIKPEQTWADFMQGIQMLLDRDRPKMPKLIEERMQEWLDGEIDADPRELIKEAIERIEGMKDMDW